MQVGVLVYMKYEKSNPSLIPVRNPSQSCSISFHDHRLRSSGRAAAGTASVSSPSPAWFDAVAPCGICHMRRRLYSARVDMTTNFIRNPGWGGLVMLGYSGIDEMLRVTMRAAG
jgi:hypothetical protein